MRIAGSLPLLPQRLMVRVETRKSWATSDTVSKSGRLLRSKFFLTLRAVVSWLSILLFVFYLIIFKYSALIYKLTDTIYLVNINNIKNKSYKYWSSINIVDLRCPETDVIKS